MKYEVTVSQVAILLASVDSGLVGSWFGVFTLKGVMLFGRGFENTARRHSTCKLYSKGELVSMLPD